MWDNKRMSQNVFQDPHTDYRRPTVECSMFMCPAIRAYIIVILVLLSNPFVPTPNKHSCFSIYFKNRLNSCNLWSKSCRCTYRARAQIQTDLGVTRYRKRKEILMHILTKWSSVTDGRTDIYGWSRIYDPFFHSFHSIPFLPFHSIPWFHF